MPEQRQPSADGVAASIVYEFTKIMTPSDITGKQTIKTDLGLKAVTIAALSLLLEKFLKIARSHGTIGKVARKVPFAQTGIADGVCKFEVGSSSTTKPRV
ncbi:hypothetical protein ACFE04_021841 [Oxalis oulophora]